MLKYCFADLVDREEGVTLMNATVLYPPSKFRLYFLILAVFTLCCYVSFKCACFSELCVLLYRIRPDNSNGWYDMRMGE